MIEVDALNDTIVGDTTALGTLRDDDTFRRRRDDHGTAPQVLPRNVYLQVDTPIGRVAAGSMVNTWGTGLLANDGLTEPDFGDAYQGSLNLRGMFATRPWARSATAGEALRSWTFLVAVDRVLQDDNASLLLDDEASAIVFGTRLQTATWAAGVFHSFRDQTDREDPWHPGADDGRTGVRTSATDLWGVWHHRFGTDRTLSVEAEATWIVGETDRSWLDETWEDGASISAVGGLARVRWDDDAERLTARLELGYASGDNDPRDDVARTFTFHTDYNVGLILFDHVLPMVAARSADRVFDPGLLAVPPAGVRFTVPQGGVTNAVYVNPVVRWRPLEPLDVRLGWLWAGRAADWVDIWQTARLGGFNSTPGGRSPGSRALGHEVNASARWSFGLPGEVVLRTGAEGGVFLPGAAFDGMRGFDTAWLGRALVDVTW